MLLLTLVACGTVSLDDAAPVPLTAPDAWAQLTPEADPLPGHRPDPVACGPATWGVEDGVLEIQTGACTYFAAAQPGAPIAEHAVWATGLAWHLGLDAPEPAEGHIALLFDGQIVWERTVAIPAEPEVFAVEVDLEPWRGSEPEVGWHLHNHGFNSWSMETVIAE